MLRGLYSTLLIECISKIYQIHYSTKNYLLWYNVFLSSTTYIFVMSYVSTFATENV